MQKGTRINDTKKGREERRERKPHNTRKEDTALTVSAENLEIERGREWGDREKKKGKAGVPEWRQGP